MGRWAATGGLYGHSHGYCCAACIPPVMAYNLPASQDKYARLAQAFGIGVEARGAEERGPLAIDLIRQLNKDLGTPPLARLLRVRDLDLLGQKAEQNTSAPTNPRPADAAAFTGMFARELDRVS